MAEELRLLDLRMKGLTEKTTSLLEKLEKSKKPENDLREIETKLKEFQNALDAANIELRHLPDDPEKGELKAKIREHKSSLKHLKNDLEWKKRSATKNELLGDHQGDTVSGPTTQEEAMRYGLDVQDESKRSLERSRDIVNQTIVIGEETVRKLQQNTEQIEGMYDKLESIETTLQRSTKVIRRMARKVATDKYLCCVVFLVFGAIVAIIVLKNIPATSNLVAGTNAVALPTSAPTSTPTTKP